MQDMCFFCEGVAETHILVPRSILAVDQVPLRLCIPCETELLVILCGYYECEDEEDEETEE